MSAPRGRGPTQIPELLISTQPTPGDVRYLEDRIYEFNAAATGIAGGEWLSILVKDEDGRIVAGICGASGELASKFASSGSRSHDAGADWEPG